MTPDTIHSRLIAVVDDLLDNGITMSQAEDAFDRIIVERGLAKSGGNITRASQRLGVHRNTIQARLRRHPTKKQQRRAARRRAAELLENEDRRKR